MGLRVPLTDIKRCKTRFMSSHRTMRRHVHRLRGQKMDLRYPRAEEQHTLPRRSIFGKDIDARARIFNALHVLFSSPEGLFSGKLSGTAIAGRW
jgi:hypothetical protein